MSHVTEFSGNEQKAFVYADVYALFLGRTSRIFYGENGHLYIGISPPLPKAFDLSLQLPEHGTPALDM